MIIIDVDQGSYEWHKTRSGIVTGTSLKSVMGSPKAQSTLINELLAERMTELQINDFLSSDMMKGKEHEPIARQKWADYIGTEYRETGMLKCEFIDDFALSPDAIVMEAGVIVGGAEIKCPTSKAHVGYLRGGAIPKDYYWQVIAPFIADDAVRWWDFVSYDHGNYHMPLFVYRAERSRYLDDIKTGRQKLAGFVEELRLAEIQMVF